MASEASVPRAPARAFVVRHVAFEDLGTFAEVLTRRGFAIELADAGVSQSFAAMQTADLVVVLGGPLGVYEGARYPFLELELAALRQRLSERRPTLGVCLGAQLMAAALGARVYPGAHKEIGWAPITLSAAGAGSCLAALGTQPVLHWHGDTFELPAGVELLASTPLYANQAFSLGPSVLGLQFHAEIEPEQFERWLICYGAELEAQGIELAAFRAQVQREGVTLPGVAEQVLEAWLDGIDLGAPGD